jgi:colanic acid biosynthesis glycosyl transferase WcaI
VTLRPGCEHLVFPSKLYGICAVERPVIFIGPPACEIARVVRENNLGHAFAGNQITEMAQALRQLAAAPLTLRRFGIAAGEFAARHDVGVGTARWAELLETLRPS